MPSMYDRNSVPYRVIAFSLSALMTFNNAAPITAALATSGTEDTTPPQITEEVVNLPQNR